MKPTIIDVNLENIEEYPPTCFLNPKNEGYKIKLDWLKKRFSEKLKIKVLFDETDKKIHGFIEYISGENAWRAVDAQDYLFIHCIWINPNSYKKKGYGSDLINECLKDAIGKQGVAVIASDDAFMATQDIFLKNGFKIIEEDGKQQLLVKQIKKGTLPKFKDYKKQLGKYKGWHIVYSHQCPWVARFIHELDKKTINKLKIKLTELKTAKQAQDAPSMYSVFNLIHDGKLLADHYISSTRFNNIVKKESQ
ncbi:MAG: GNAT family N-acetyltransferase [Candidatus Aminicenantes bacterium]|nr:GNAT family N-acetyltransferase [Candidatus Aminicenantes bacterium]